MRKVKFFVSTGYSQTAIEEEFTLQELGIDEDEYETEEELREDISEAFEEWIFENIETSWDFE